MRLKFSQMKLERLQKISEGTSLGASIPTHSSRTISETYASFVTGLLDLKVFTMHLLITLIQKVRRCALELEDINLLAKLAPGDMIALEAKYHRKYFRNLYNRARVLYSVDAQNDSDNDHFHGIAFAELVALMEEHRREEGIVPIFKLTDLAFMYKA